MKRRKSLDEAELVKLEQERQKQLESVGQLEVRLRQDDEQRSTDLQRLEREQPITKNQGNYSGQRIMERPTQRRKVRNPRKGKYAGFSSVEFEGVIEVTDSVLFAKVLFDGIDPAREWHADAHPTPYITSTTNRLPKAARAVSICSIRLLCRKDKSRSTSAQRCCSDLSPLRASGSDRGIAPCRFASDHTC